MLTTSQNRVFFLCSFFLPVLLGWRKVVTGRNGGKLDHTSYGFEANRGRTRKRILYQPAFEAKQRRTVQTRAWQLGQFVL